jgi:hypothetical protein
MKLSTYAVAMALSTALALAQDGGWGPGGG